MLRETYLRSVELCRRHGNPRQHLERKMTENEEEREHRVQEDDHVRLSQKKVDLIIIYDLIKVL